MNTRPSPQNLYAPNELYDEWKKKTTEKSNTPSKYVVISIGLRCFPKCGWWKRMLSHMFCIKVSAVKGPCIISLSIQSNNYHNEHFCLHLKIDWTTFSSGVHIMVKIESRRTTKTWKIFLLSFLFTAVFWRFVWRFYFKNFDIRDPSTIQSRVFFLPYFRSKSNFTEFLTFAQCLSRNNARIYVRNER